LGKRKADRPFAGDTASFYTRYRRDWARALISRLLERTRVRGRLHQSPELATHGAVVRGVSARPAAEIDGQPLALLVLISLEQFQRQ
jgi:hypothetical protein